MPAFGVRRRSKYDVNRCEHSVRLVTTPVVSHRVNSNGEAFTKISFRAANNSSPYTTKATGFINYYAMGKLADRIVALDLEIGDEVFVLSRYKSKKLRRKDKGDIDISEFQIDWLCLTAPGKISLEKYGDAVPEKEAVGDLDEPVYIEGDDADD